MMLYQHFCRRKRRQAGYDAVGMNDDGAAVNDDDDGGWTSYDASAFDWDPEEARVKRRLNVMEAKKKRLNRQVEIMDQQLTARRRALDRVSDTTAQLTSRLASPREPTSMGSNIGHIPADSPALAAVDAKGREMFGDKWTQGENGGPPIRSILSLAPEDLEEIKRGLETAREETLSSRGIRRGAGVAAGTSASVSGDHDYTDHSGLLARTSMLADRLRAASLRTSRRHR